MNGNSSNELRINSYLMNTCPSGRGPISSEGEHSHHAGYGSPLSTITNSARAIQTSQALAPFSPLSMAHYMPYLSGLSHVDLLQHYAAIAATSVPLSSLRLPQHHTVMAPNSPLFGPFGIPSSVPDTQTLADLGDKPMAIEDR